MTVRTPGLTPTNERALHARLSAQIHTTAAAGPEGSPPSLEALLPELVRIVIEALPVTPPSPEVLVLVRRTQTVSDALRHDGKAGYARDIDRLAGILHGIAVENANLKAVLDGYRYASAPCATTTEDRLDRLDRAKGQDPGARLPRDRIKALAAKG